MNRHQSEVQHWMTEKPFTISSAVTLFQAYDYMTDNAIRRLLVTDSSGELIGIITLSDILRVIPFSSEESQTKTNLLLDVRTVEAVMTSEPLTVGPDDTVQEAAELMLENRVSGLPVVQSSRPVGIITESDIFRLVVDSWSLVAA